jgi:hypothetical protein
MWSGHLPALADYGFAICDEWTGRGYVDNCRPQIAELRDKFVADGMDDTLPSWFGDDALHLSHQSNLIRKMPEHYGPMFPGVSDDLEYVWPGAA